MIFGIELKPWIEKAIRAKKYKKFTEIQEKTIPTLLRNKNLIGISNTGTGKTLAFIVPIMNKIELNNELQSIIISPTRELARQINSQFNDFKKHESKLKTSLLIGGTDQKKQIEQIKKSKPQIIICTVTRLKELINKNQIDLSKITSIVLDEADMLIDLGFAKDIDFIFDKVDNPKLQKMAWSATIHDLLSQTLSKYFGNTKIIKVGDSIYTNKNIKHYIIHNANKEKALKIFINKISPYICIIFTSQKKQINHIVELLKMEGINPAIIHGGLTSRDRKNIYKSIKDLNHQYIVASDLASRGLDIDGVSHVINWDLPDNAEWYVHRSGRSGRSKYQGESYLFFDGNQEKNLYNLQQKGIKFNHITISNNQFIEKKYVLRSNQNKKLDDKSIVEIKKITSSKAKKIKPNYKKKQKKKIDKIKQKSKRKYLEAKIKEQRINTYKEENRKK